MSEDHQHAAGAPGPPQEAAERRQRGAVLRALALVVVVALVATAGATGALPDIETVQREVHAFGRLAPLVYVLAYAVLAMLPVPASLLTVAGGTLFGFASGSALAVLGAWLAAVGAFEVGRLLGRDAVERLTRGRLQRVQRVLGEHGVLAVLAVRLTPIFPFLVINYAAGLSNLRRRDYVVGTGLGIVPGAVAFASVGAYGTDPWRLFAALVALVSVAAGGAAVGRRMLRRRGVDVRGGERRRGAAPGRRSD